MVTEQKWGESDGNVVSLYTLENRKGMKVKLTNLGAAVMAIEYKGVDVALGYDHLETLKGQPGYLGVIAGRFANRIRDSRFELDGTEYTLAKNNGNNHLHGGLKGFDKVVWNIDQISQSGNSVRFFYFSSDGEEGYPGNLASKVTYTLDEDCALQIEYEAVTDKATLVNLTNHTYFNLSGHASGTIEKQWLKINSETFMESDDGCVPTGKLLPVAGTPFDFRQFHRIGERIEQDDIQLKYGEGYDHCYVLDHAASAVMEADTVTDIEEMDEMLKLAAEAYCDKTHIYMQVYTDMPGIQFYSGNHLNTAGKSGVVYGKRTGFCLETQYFPDAIHHPEFPQPVLRPGQVYRTSTIYRFTEHEE
jgi:aldose 1-epimerase